ncbi:hypothetical protein [Microtetraspora niveoalba]|uniref:hypothetical protein n=1 Tax=Microtetraspora niveoalba TaxID=46175 RepID=UPI00082BE95A|nr:hypothetical protein [Microtetraspora niveoalba]
MPRLHCPTCSGTMPGHLQVCRSCAAGTLRDLADVPSLTMELDRALARQNVFGDRAGGRSAETALPWDQRAREARHVLRSALSGWTHYLADGIRPMAGPICRARCEHQTCTYISLGRPPRRDATPGAMAVWLLRHQRQLLGRATADEAVDEIREAVRLARRAIDRPPSLWYAGPCGVGGCDADLYARHGSAIIRCRACYATHDTAARETWLLRQATHHLGTATEIARALTGFGYEVTPARIWQWAHRGRLAARGRGRRGPLYRVGDVLDLLTGAEPLAVLGPACAKDCKHPTCKLLRTRPRKAA